VNRQRARDVVFHNNIQLAFHIFNKGYTEYLDPQEDHHMFIEKGTKTQAYEMMNGKNIVTKGLDKFGCYHHLVKAQYL
jgi:hypothetical protein